MHIYEMDSLDDVSIFSFSDAISFDFKNLDSSKAKYICMCWQRSRGGFPGIR